MHLGNGAITPECAVLTASIAAAGLGFAAASAQRETINRQTLLGAGIYGAAIFAAQMFNVPVLSYSSGHLVGGVLLAIALRPGLGALTMSVVLMLQALLLGDGGFVALGANIINMALLPAALVALGNVWQTGTSSLRQQAMVATVQATMAVLLGAGLIVLEVGLFQGSAPLTEFARQMMWVHLLLALAEGLLTGVLVWLVQGNFVPQIGYRWRFAWASAATLLLIVALPWASDLGDGFESSAERSGWQRLLTDEPSELVSLGSINATLNHWQQQATRQIASFVPNEQALALMATILTGAFSAALAMACSRRPLSAAVVGHTSGGSNRR